MADSLDYVVLCCESYPHRLVMVCDIGLTVRRLVVLDSELVGDPSTLRGSCSYPGVSDIDETRLDYGYWSGVLGLEQFARDFGVYDSSSDSYSIPSTWQSVGSGPPIAGLAMGAMLTGFVGNKIGRLWTFRVSSVLSIVGIIVQATSMNSYWQIVVGRIINSMALGILSNTIPAYLAEVSPLSIRGGLVNFYQFSIAVGALLVNTCTWGMQYRKDQWAYRLTIIVQIICPVIFLPWSFFIPESPRWLIGKGRGAEAEKSLAYLRSTTSREVIQQETQLIAAAEEDNKRQFGHSWIECLK